MEASGRCSRQSYPSQSRYSAASKVRSEPVCLMLRRARMATLAALLKKRDETEAASAKDL